MRRTVFNTDFGLVDIYLCRSDAEHQYDWMFHSFGEAKPEALTPVSYTHLTLPTILLV